MTRGEKAGAFVAAFLFVLAAVFAVVLYGDLFTDGGASSMPAEPPSSTAPAASSTSTTEEPVTASTTEAPSILNASPQIVIPAPVQAVPVSRCNGDFSCFKDCTLPIESGGNYANTNNPTYRGAWQFDQNTWRGAVTRAGFPDWAEQDPAGAPPNVQDAAALQLYQERGNQPWAGRC